ncbi:M56 family metallopeptidase [Bizionia paragorgiae]|uniref:M56 family metallopeptidase n=1 Tax=Bizionia paragorgiae TaxID=283786 RepID=UPI003A8D4F8B
MLHYCIQIIVFQSLFLLVYDIVLKKETFFNYNRAYLLVTVLISLVIPFVKIDHFKRIIPEAYVVSLPEVIIGSSPHKFLGVQHLDPVFISNITVFTWENLLFFGWVISALILSFKVFQIIKLLRGNQGEKQGLITLIYLKNSTSAFSFFNFIFLGDAISTSKRSAILAHEKVHVSQKHSLDLLVFELLRILFWFNPLIYIYQKRIAEVHEFIADSKAVKQHSKKVYYENLLSQVFDTQSISFINPFFKQSLIKKRIIMLSKSKSNRVNVLKYTLVLPLVVFMLVYTSCTAQEDNTNQNLSIVQQIEALKSSISTQGTITPLEEKALVELVEMLEESKVNTLKIEREHLLLNNQDSFSFLDIDEVPAFAECEDLGSNTEKRKCFSKMVNTFVANHFNPKVADELKLVGNQKISVFFTIAKNGEIKDIKTRGPHILLEEEAKRVVSLLPKINAGKQDGKPVNVTFFLPIHFMVK